MPNALQFGIGYEDFWNYTFEELLIIRENNLKGQLRRDYQLASMIAVLVGHSMSGGKGKKPPTLYKMYPDLFAAELEEEQYMAFRNALLAKAKYKED